MNTLEIAKMLGRAIQEEKSYTAVMVAKQNNDEDEELQNKIGQMCIRDSIESAEYPADRAHHSLR